MTEEEAVKEEGKVVAAFGVKFIEVCLAGIERIEEELRRSLETADHDTIHANVVAMSLLVASMQGIL